MKKTLDNDRIFCYNDYSKKTKRNIIMAATPKKSENFVRDLVDSSGKVTLVPNNLDDKSAPNFYCPELGQTFDSVYQSDTDPNWIIIDSEDLYFEGLPTPRPKKGEYTPEKDSQFQNECKILQKIASAKGKSLSDVEWDLAENGHIPKPGYQGKLRGSNSKGLFIVNGGDGGNPFRIRHIVEMDAVRVNFSSLWNRGGVKLRFNQKSRYSREYHAIQDTFHSTFFMIKVSLLLPDAFTISRETLGLPETPSLWNLAA